MELRNPFVLVGLLGLAIPIAIHLLVRAPARQVPFPSLRFLQGSRMRAFRRSLLRDPGLLSLRLLILAFATLALADPLLMTACRQASWDARVVRAVIVEERVAGSAAALAESSPRAWRQTRIVGPDLDEGVRRGLLWLESVPPARREIVIVSPLRLGALRPSTLLDVPGGIGIRFVRVSHEPADDAHDAAIAWLGLEQGVPTIRGGGVGVDAAVTVAQPSPSSRTGTRRLTLAERPDGLVVPELHFTVLAAGEDRRAARAAVHAVAATGVAVGETADRPLIVAIGQARGERAPLQGLWMARVADALATDPEIATLAAATGAVGRPHERPAAVVRDRDGAPLVTVAARRGAAPHLVVEIWSPPASPLLPLVMRRALAARTPLPRWTDLETVSVPDGTLQEWSRPPAAPTATPPSLSDRRWFWVAVLVLLAVEALWRRGSRHARERDAYDHAA